MAVFCTHWASIVIQNISEYMGNIHVEYDMSKLKLGNIQIICILIAAQSPKHALIGWAGKPLSQNFWNKS
jgi:hypothetical protein